MLQNTALIPPHVARLIDERLDRIERDFSVRILLAVESGSRAWGFPSPDSDYDVRFVYVHRRDWYLSLFEGRDVIELPIEGDLDINGWDLRKALRLLLKPNPVLLEWLRSPVVYRADHKSFARLSSLAGRVAHQRASVHHYLHLADSQYRRFIADRPEIRLKKYFYVLRPVLALMWLRERPTEPVPMSVPELRAGITLPPAISHFLDRLLILKASSKELGVSARNAELDAIIEQEIERARSAPSDIRPKSDTGVVAAANALFMEELACQP